MIKHLASALGALAVVGTLASGLTSCSSSADGRGQAGRPTARTADGARTSETTAGSPTPTTAAELGAKLLSGTRSTTSAHLDLSVTFAGQTLHGSGDEKLSNGRPVAMELTESVPGAGKIQIILVGGKTYVKLPQQRGPRSKPYLLISPHSSDPVVRQVAGSINSALSAGSLNTYDMFVRAANSIKAEGRETVNGVSATHYTVVMDVRKIPAASALNKQALAESGLKTIPVQLWVDDQGRPVKMTADARVQGHTVHTVGTTGRYNQPVTITAPPANQVSAK